jgi:Flp pilus assembly protein protease CpaA
MNETPEAGTREAHSTEPVEEAPPAAAAAAEGPVLETLPLPASGGRPLFNCGSGVAWAVILSATLVLAAALQMASGQTERGFVLPALCGVILSIATLSDIATRRIANRLTYPAILLGLALNLGVSTLGGPATGSTVVLWMGSTGVSDAAWGFGVAALIGLVSFPLRGLGGGDVKLLAAVGAMVGLHVFAAIMFNAVIVAAVLGGMNWICGGAPMRRLQVATLALYTRLFRHERTRAVYCFRPTESPFALALMAGFLVAPFEALHRSLLGVPW